MYYPNPDAPKLLKVEDLCIRHLLSNDLNCNFEYNEEVEIKQLAETIIITKNLKELKVNRTRTQQQIKIKGHNLIRFNNCTIT